MMTAMFGINDAGLIVGIGTDPNNAARNVGMVYDSVADTAIEVGAISGAIGAIAFDVSNAGGQFFVSWFYDGNTTFSLQELIGDNTGRDLSMNTSSMYSVSVKMA